MGAVGADQRMSLWNAVLFIRQTYEGKVVSDKSRDKEGLSRLGLLEFVLVELLCWGNMRLCLYASRVMMMLTHPPRAFALAPSQVRSAVSPEQHLGTAPGSARRR